jgi:serine/threonine protein kinase
MKIVASHNAKHAELHADTSRVSTEDTLDAKQTHLGGATNLPVGYRFGKFEIRRLLGEGGMGAVYLAVDVGLGREVALKLPKMSTASAVEQIDRFHREARTAASLMHPGICPIYEFGHIDGQFYFAMAYIQGRELSTLIKEPIHARQIALLVRKLAQAVAAAHAKGIIHRDLKPSNVMIDKQGQPIILDFGLARSDQSCDKRLTQTGAFVGTPGFGSPEQITNQTGSVDHRTDVYSLGVIMYTMLAGRLPFQSDSSIGMLAQILTETPLSPMVYRANSSPKLCAIAMKAIQRDVEERYQSVRLLADDLTDYLENDAASITADRSLDQDFVEHGEHVPDGITAIEFDWLKLLEGDFQAEQKDAFFSAQSLVALAPNSPRQIASKSSVSGGGRSRVLRITLASGFFALMIAWAIVMQIRTKHGTVRVEIDGDPSGVQIDVDGESIAVQTLQAGYQIDVGPHAMSVHADGMQAQSTEFTIGKGTEKILRFSFQPIAETHAVATDSPSPAGSFLEIATPASSSSDIVFQDFEDGTYGNWTASGVSFGSKPYSPRQHPRGDNSILCGFNGQHIADSFFASDHTGDDAYTGKLISPTFAIQNGYVNFLVAMAQGTNAEVLLVIDEKVVHRCNQVTFPMVMQPECWDVHEFVGKSARIEVIDNATGTDGRVCVDHFVFSDANHVKSWREKIQQQALESSFVWKDRTYFLSKQQVRFATAESFAKMIAGELFVPVSPEESAFVATHIEEPVMTGLRNEQGVWRNPQGIVSTHVPWQFSIPTDGANEFALFTKHGEFVDTGDTSQIFLVVRGERPSAPARLLDIEFAKENRAAAELLQSKLAHLAVATSDKFSWLHPTAPLPKEDFEIRKIGFAPQTHLTDEEIDLFGRVRGITWIDQYDGNDSILELLKFSSNLRVLVLNDGKYNWEPFDDLVDGHPLRKFLLTMTEAPPDVLETVLRSSRLDELIVTYTNLDFGIVDRLIEHRHSLQVLEISCCGEVSRENVRQIAKLDRLSHLDMYCVGVVDEDLSEVGKLKRLEHLRIGYGVLTGRTLNELKDLARLKTLDYSCVGLDDQTLISLPPLPALETLDVFHTKLAGETLGHLNQFPNLRTLNIRGNSIGNDQLSLLQGSPTLLRVNAKDSKITTEAMQEFAAKRLNFSSDLLDDIPVP